MSDYDYVYLMPKEISTIRSRSDVSLSSNFLGLYPIIASPMKGITGSKLVIEMGKNNCLGILHRFDKFENRVININKIANANVPFGVAIGVNDFEEELRIATWAVNQGACLICVDIANGYLPQIKECGKILKDNFGDRVKLMTGNVVNAIGAQYIKDSGYDFVRCSIGSGNLCTTRAVTGIARNALAALSDCRSVDIELVIDGGIRQPGDVVKSFAMGADWAMLGSTLAYAKEAENKNGRLYGMASFINHKLNNKTVKSIEGRDAKINPREKKPLKEILDQYLWGIRSACTYLNANSYKDIFYKAQIISTTIVEDL